MRPSLSDSPQFSHSLPMRGFSFAGRSAVWLKMRSAPLGPRRGFLPVCQARTCLTESKAMGRRCGKERAAVVGDPVCRHAPDPLVNFAHKQLANYVGAGEHRCQHFSRSTPSHAGLLWEPQGLVQMRVVEDIPEPIYGFAMRPRLIAEYALDLSQRKRENCVAAALQR